MAGNADLITYYETTHAERIYGTSSVKHIPFVRPWVHVRQPRSIIDYGCGQSHFTDLLKLGPQVRTVRYDPAIPDYAALPTESFDLLINIDVLEHIEEADVDTVLAEMRALSPNAIIIIDTKAAHHTLPDGRNAHVTLRPHAWWHKKLSQHFDHVEPISTRRSSRAGFKTWPSTVSERLRYRALRAAEAAGYYARRLVGRHKTQWLVSTTKPKKGDKPAARA